MGRQQCSRCKCLKQFKDFNTNRHTNKLNKTCKKCRACASYRENVCRRDIPVCNCCTKKELKAFYYNAPAGCEVGHILPKEKGGSHCLKNLQYLT